MAIMGRNTAVTMESIPAITKRENVKYIPKGEQDEQEQRI